MGETEPSFSFHLLRRNAESLASVFQELRRNEGRLLVVSLVIVVVTILWILMVNRQRKSEAIVPPGDLGFSSLGDTLQFTRSYYNLLDFKAYVDKKVVKYGSVFKVRFLNQPTVFLDAPGGFKLLFGHNDEDLIKGYWPEATTKIVGKKALFQLSGHTHKSVKSYLVKHFLGVDRVRIYQRRMEVEIIHNLQTFWLAGKTDGAVLETHDLLKRLTFGLICNLVLGITDVEDVRKLLPIFYVWQSGLFSLPINLPGFQFHRSMKSRVTILEEFLMPHVQRRREELKTGRASYSQDFLSILLTHPDEHGNFYGDEHIGDNLLTLLAAGTDTTASTLTMVFKLCAAHPDVYEELLREHTVIAGRKKEGEMLTMVDVASMKYTWMVLQETMRLYTAVGAIFREAKTSFEYKGFTIPQGWKLVAATPMSHWNSELHKDPLKFVPARFASGVRPFTYFPFGGGHRLCPGLDFAKVFMSMFLHHALRHMRWTAVDPQEKIVMDAFPRPVGGGLIEITRCNLY